MKFFFKVSILFLLSILVWLGAWNTKNLFFDNSQWFAKNHPEKMNIDYLHSEYDKGESIIFIVHLQKDYFQPAMIATTKKITKNLEQLDYVESIQTPLNASLPFSDKDNLSILSFASALEKKILLDFKSYRSALQGSFYYKRLISEDLQNIAFVISMKKSATGSNSLRRKNLIEQAQSIFLVEKDFQNISIVGEGMLNYQLDKTSQADLKFLLPLAVLLMLVLLFFMFPVWQHILLIIITAILGLLLAFNIILLQNHPLTVVGLALPVMILVIVVADSIHIVSRWNFLVENKTPPQKAVTLAIRQTWLPCLGTSLTTAIGFGSFYFSNLIPLKNFGWDSFFSIILCYFLIIFVNWIFLAVFCKLIPSNKKRHYQIIKKIVQICFQFSQKFQKSILFVCLLAMVFLVYQFKNIRIETNFLDVFFQKKSDLYQDFLFVDKHFNGTGLMDIILTPEKSQDFNEFSLFQKTKDINEQLLSITNIKDTQSYLDSISMLHQELTTESKLPQNQEQLGQELLFLELSRGDNKTDVISPYVLFDYSEARIHLQTPNLNSQEIFHLKEKIVQILKNFQGISFLLTGSSIFFHSLSKEVLQTQLTSVFSTLAITWLIFALFFGVWLGTIGLIVSVFPVLLISGIIIFLKIPFDFAVILIGSISFGLSVDDTIHLLHNYKKQTGSLVDRLQKSTQILSHPLVFTTLLFMIGAGVFLASDLVVLIKFGFFACFAILMALFSTLILLPALLVFFNNLKQKIK